MIGNFEWTQERFDTSLTSRCWWYTPYDIEAESRWKLVFKDNEFKELVYMESQLESIPTWVEKIINRICYIPPCGHYMFPEPFLQVINLIGSSDLSVIEKSYPHTCYCVKHNRKEAAMDYCLCLDAWLANTSSDIPARELEALGFRKIDWYSVCNDLWETLGEHTLKKELLIELTLHVIRHAIKASSWDDDKATNFGRDEYLGDFYMDSKGCAVFKQWNSPRLKNIESRLSELCPEWRNIVTVDYGFWWLCAPKVFRFLERNLWAIGKMKPLKPDEKVPGFLRCEDTYPDQDKAALWYREFYSALNSWWEGKNTTKDISQRLGEPTPTKKWLVRLFRHKLRLLELNGEEFASLINPENTHRKGSKPLVI
ncbi:hypothetical protein GF312_05880 [Candidatus Poribacteria bacterium]|nr:hypothetical protein [Candidatus Poribacteria bacterium]